MIQIYLTKFKSFFIQLKIFKKIQNNITMINMKKEEFENELLKFQQYSTRNFVKDRSHMFLSKKVNCEIKYIKKFDAYTSIEGILMRKNKDKQSELILKMPITQLNNLFELFQIYRMYNDGVIQTN